MGAETTPFAPPVGRRERRKRATRAEILDAGRRLLGEKGLYESRIEDVTGLAGIAKGTLYTYFADKDELIRAVVAEGFAALAAEVARASRGAHTLPALTRRIVRVHLAFFARHPDRMRIFHQARGMLKFDRPEWRALRNAHDAYFATLAGVLGRSPRVARLRLSQRLDLARILFGALSGVTSVRAAVEPGLVAAPPSADLLASLEAMVAGYVTSCARRLARPAGRA